MSILTTLVSLRDALASVSGVMTCKIGFEANISPSFYPLIRLVPSRILPGRPYTNRTCDLLIYFGTPTANSEGLETVYANIFELEDSIRAVLSEQGARYLETFMDEDRLPMYKLSTIRCEVVG